MQGFFFVGSSVMMLVTVHTQLLYILFGLVRWNVTVYTKIPLHL